MCLIVVCERSYFVLRICYAWFINIQSNNTKANFLRWNLITSQFSINNSYLNGSFWMGKILGAE